MTPSYITKPIHFFLGFVTSLLDPVSQVLVVVLFLVYELWEDRVKNDRDYPSVAEFLSGYVAGKVSMLLGWIPA